jgi:hypothetical protein
MAIHPEIEQLLIGLDAAERDARGLADGFSEDQGRWRETSSFAGSRWCLVRESAKPPVRSRMRAPAQIRPKPSPGLRESFDAFLREQQQVRDFFRQPRHC